MGFLEVLKTVGDLAVTFTRHQELVQLLSADRESGKNHIERIVQFMSPQELDQYEADFLEYATTTIVDPQHRRRAMELYAWLKIQELGHYREFRGFVGHG